MSTSRITRILSIAIATAVVAGIGATVSAGPAAAHDLVATDQATVVAASSRPTAVASIPRGIVVANHAGKSVALFAKGEPDRRKPRPGSSPATFTGLTAGRTYLVAINERVIGRVTAVNRPLAASGLVVRTTDAPDSVQVTWKHRPTRATGGTAIAYVVTASAQGEKPITTTVRGRRTATLQGLNPTVRYSFTVTPRNSAGAGGSAHAAMTRTLNEISGRGGSVAVTAPETPRLPAAPAVPAPAPVAETSSASSAAPSAPSAPSRPATRTIYLCPEGYTDTGTACSRTQPYTYATLAFTFHQEQTGSTPVSMGTCDAVRNVWDGFSWNVEHYSYSCAQGGLPIYGQVKDPAPAGYTDNGTEWSKRNDPPAGWTDNGSAYEQTAAKVAHEVLA